MKQQQKEKQINEQLTEIKSLLKQKDRKPLNFVEAAQYLSISQSTLYKLTYQRKIPCHKPNGKYLYFFKHELDNWIVKSVECRTKSEASPAGSLGMTNRKKKSVNENSVKNSDASAALSMTNNEEEEPP